jgi:hypothetical protein
VIFLFQKTRNLATKKKFLFSKKQFTKRRKKKEKKTLVATLQFKFFGKKTHTNLNLAYGTEPGIAGGGASYCCTLCNE